MGTNKIGDVGAEAHQTMDEARDYLKAEGPPLPVHLYIALNNSGVDPEAFEAGIMEHIESATQEEEYDEDEAAEEFDFTVTERELIENMEQPSDEALEILSRHLLTPTREED
jgi:hypothetical protein